MPDSDLHAPLTEARGLVRGFAVTRGLFHRAAGILRAVDGVSFSVAAGETLGLVGESGCGKSTLAKLMMGLLAPDSGEILFEGRPAYSGARPPFQMVFQDPFSSLNPRMKVGASVGEPLAAQGMSRSEIRDRVAAALKDVGLPPESASRYPHQFSGGQRQRLAIARAFVTSPRFVVCDEAVSALDASVRAQVLNLLSDIQAERRFGCLFISHDLAVVGHMSDRIAVMYLGRFVEIGTRDEVLFHSAHPYTHALLASAPGMGRCASNFGIRGFAEEKNETFLLEGEPASPLSPPSGCAFHLRCPHASEICRIKRPELVAVGADHQAACHLLFQGVGNR